ncbi:HNH endonuclease [Rhodococcus sp. A5(2022)]|uniref:HNH endonuclease n=1 Tax=Rhodococcus sp. A5(2022) TaxID=3003588 RepID=UPI003FA6E491
MLCALCKTPLIRPSDTAGDRDALIGEEAHIVGQGTNGPRSGSLDASEIDRYDNLLLLCANDHALVDEQSRIPATVDTQRVAPCRPQPLLLAGRQCVHDVTGLLHGHTGVARGDDPPLPDGDVRVDLADQSAPASETVRSAHLELHHPRLP